MCGCSEQGTCARCKRDDRQRVDDELIGELTAEEERDHNRTESAAGVARDPKEGLR